MEPGTLYHQYKPRPKPAAAAAPPPLESYGIITKRPVRAPAPIIIASPATPPIETIVPVRRGRTHRTFAPIGGGESVEAPARLHVDIEAASVVAVAAVAPPDDPMPDRELVRVDRFAKPAPRARSRSKGRKMPDASCDLRKMPDASCDLRKVPDEAAPPSILKKSRSVSRGRKKQV